VQKLYHDQTAKILKKMSLFGENAVRAAQKNGKKKRFCLNSAHLLHPVQQMFQPSRLRGMHEQVVACRGDQPVAPCLGLGKKEKAVVLSW
jgi:hypothetical protein